VASVNGKQLFPPQAYGGQQVGLLRSHGAPRGVQVVVLVVDDDEDVDVVPLVQVVSRENDDAGGHELLHAWPAGQHVRFTPLPHGVVPAGQPQNDWEASAQGTPLLQHDPPHGVVPLGQQQEEAGSEHLPPDGQHPAPHTWLPAGHVTAAPRKGRSRVAPTAAAPAPASSFSAPRRELGCAMARERLSKPSLTGSSFEAADGPPKHL
jgi:hypothetical protein